MKVSIRYFASLREITGQASETLELAENASIADARTVLLERYPRLQPVMERSVCAVNRRYVPAETSLHNGDEIAFIPPTGGGQPWSPSFN
ncbi:MAG TPA: MoaD/ThiS family protein [Dictyobacter sp.]|jgi:molybdopterin converting factor subunit 1|nr:MoaD/ThiS family protein [Dictyobacter sp.]